VRIGKNPLKELGFAVAPPARVTVGVLNYIPDRSGYFKDQLEVLKLCLNSIAAHAGDSVDLLVVDNGSTGDVIDYLMESFASGLVTQLVLNRRNAGKANAVLQILRTAPGELVCYTDGDIYFKPGWLEAHLEIMEVFPRVGVVGGIPLRNQAAHSYSQRAVAWIEKNFDGEIEIGDLIPEDWTRDFLASLGLTGEEASAQIDAWRDLQDCRIVSDGKAAFVGAAHMQFLISRAAIEALPHQRFEYALEPGEDHLIDQAIDDLGLLRLSTPRPYVYHIGNRVAEDWLVEEYERLVGGPLEKTTAPRDPRAHWFWGRSRVRDRMRAVSDWLFEKYYGN
jgi:glycosyltransferase involved in cell wall biosynthesis